VINCRHSAKDRKRDGLSQSETLHSARAAVDSVGIPPQRYVCGEFVQFPTHRKRFSNVGLERETIIGWNHRIEPPIIRAVGTYFSLSELAMMRHSVMP